MNSICWRLPFAVALLMTVPALCARAIEPSDPADLPAPISNTASQPMGSIDELGDGPVKPDPYRWLEDDAVTPASRSTVAAYATFIDDVDPNNILERPGIPVGWYSALEVTAANPRLSFRQNSGSLLSGTFPDPIAPTYAPLDWTAMPKFTLGYRRPEGYGDLSVSYRFLLSQGSQSLSQFSGGGTGSGSSNLQLHVMDFDYNLSDLFPNDLWLMPRQIRLTAGARVAGIQDKATNSGGSILSQSATNRFVGAGPRLALESLYPISSHRWTLFSKFEGAGVIGVDRQSYSQSVSGSNNVITSGSASNSVTVGVPVIGLKAGLNWLPDWGGGNVKMSAGYQWERWFFLGTDTTSNNELTIQGPFVRGEVAF